MAAVHLRLENANHKPTVAEKLQTELIDEYLRLFPHDDDEEGLTPRELFETKFLQPFDEAEFKIIKSDRKIQRPVMPTGIRDTIMSQDCISCTSNICTRQNF